MSRSPTQLFVGLDQSTLKGTTITPREDFGGFNNRSLYWFNPLAFTQAAPLTFGTAGRDIIASPGFMNWDISLFKTFVLA